MAIALEFIDFVVPISVIRAKYPGGWEQCVSDHESLVGGRVWFDRYLFRDGAMNPSDIGHLVEPWAALGFEPTATRDGHQVWNDVCVVEAMFGGTTLPCDWLVVDTGQRVAYLKGTEAGPIAGREEPRRAP